MTGAAATSHNCTIFVWSSVISPKNGVAHALKPSRYAPKFIERSDLSDGNINNNNNNQ